MSDGFTKPGLWQIDEWLDEGVVSAMQKPSVADLVAALQEEGGQVLTLELDEYDGLYGFADENGITVMPDDGTYLVVRIDGETP